jgi:hypothetical protein
MRIRTTLDYNRLILEIRSINHRKKLYHFLKTELSNLGYWRNLKRGNPKLGFAKAKHQKEDW